MKQKPKLELKLLIFLHFTFTLIVKWAGFNVATCTCLCSLGYLLADDPQGETPLIPSEVMEFSIKHSTEVDINTTLQILGSPGEKASSIPGCNRTDSVIRYCALFISCLFAFCFVFLSWPLHFFPDIIKNLSIFSWAVVRCYLLFWLSCWDNNLFKVPAAVWEFCHCVFRCQQK